MEQDRQNFADVAFLLLERFRHAIDQRGRRIVGHKALSEFQRNEMRGLRAGGQHAQDFPALIFAFGLDAMSKDELRSGFVDLRFVLESAAQESRARAWSSAPHSSSCPGRTTSLDFSPWRPADLRICPGRAGESPPAHSWG